MSRFAFRLDAPLRLARVRRGELRRDLAALMRELVTLEKEIAEEGSRLDEIDADRSGRIAAGIPGDDLARLSHTRDSISARAASLQMSVEAIKRDERRARDDLAVIGRQIEVLDRLRSDARATHVKTLVDKEQAESDDLTLRRFATREPESGERAPR
ncbi:MAG: flagellar FliJ family protein [Acidobacteriota bacterium]|nr:flagellar FliJ family protein [Acidobacteriota bacterium]